MPENVTWSDIDIDENGPKTLDIYYTIPAAFAVYLVRKVLELTIINPLGRHLKVHDDREDKKSSMRFEMFREHMWELLYYAANFVWAIQILWNASYFWNVSELFLNYPQQVNSESSYN